MHRIHPLPGLPGLISGRRQVLLQELTRVSMQYSMHIYTDRKSSSDEGAKGPQPGFGGLKVTLPPDPPMNSGFHACLLHALGKNGYIKGSQQKDFIPDARTLEN